MKKNTLMMSSILITFSQIAFSHSLTPGFMSVDSLSETETIEYSVFNRTQVPSVYRIEVLKKDMTPATGWKSDTHTLKVRDGHDKSFKLKFKTDESRKLIICTTLDKRGYNLEKPQLVTRVCSRLILRRIK